MLGQVRSCAILHFWKMNSPELIGFTDIIVIATSAMKKRRCLTVQKHLIYKYAFKKQVYVVNHN